ncbi:hypothetical protein [Streptomyces sp. LUP30]|uniref:hypothetical protein n=1 Tax=Streptomyces sp. LUP30 TaxID=1890285 RepID=UPI00210DCE27|nr:hypothetical protein [Streptomyces sp. LUP30]
MSESVPVRCPACRRERLYTVPSYPCACGSPVTPVLDRRTAPTAVAHRAWDDEWIVLGCRACGRRGQWPQPELGCACGRVLRIPVTGQPAEPEPEHGPGPEHALDAEHEPGPEHEVRPDHAPGRRPGPGPQSEREAVPGPDQVRGPDDIPGPDHVPGRGPGPGPEAAREAGPGPGRETAAPVPAPPRRAFRPVAIRTARDAVTAAALYLNWLGHGDIRRADQRPTSGIGLAARGLLAQVDPSVHPASLRDVECLWLTAMTESAECVYFSLAGYADDARARADQLRVPLFVLDLTGSPQPVNATADAVASAGARDAWDTWDLRDAQRTGDDGDTGDGRDRRDGRDAHGGPGVRGRGRRTPPREP